MKILFLADEESKMYWEYFKKEDFKGIDVIVSCGDLNPSYLSFLTTMVGVPNLDLRLEFTICVLNSSQFINTAKGRAVF